MQLLNKNVGLVPPVVAQLHQLVLFLLVDSSQLIAAASGVAKSELIACQYLLLQLFDFRRVLFNYPLLVLNLPVESHCACWVFLRLWHLLVEGVNVCAGEEAMLESCHGIWSKGSHDVVLSQSIEV